MTRQVLGALTMLNLSTHLDAMFVELYGIVDYFTTPGYAGATTKATIDSSGNFLLGTGTATATPANGCQLYGGSIGFVAVGHANGTGSGNAYANFAYNSGQIGSISQSGTTAVIYSTTSDERLKKNIVDAAEAGAIIDAIRVRAFDWKAADNEHVTHGFIAQELATIAPQAVKVGDDGGGDEVVDAWAVDPSKLVALLIKEVQDLRGRVVALEAR